MVSVTERAKKRKNRSLDGRDVAFVSALTPLEAAVLPAQERRMSGALSMIRTAYEAGQQRRCPCAVQRAKIWVR